jgi:hypothetical protein
MGLVVGLVMGLVIGLVMGMTCLFFDLIHFDFSRNLAT